MDALAAAKHGTLCIWNNKLPRDFAAMMTALQDLDARPLLIVCAHQPHEAEAFGVAPIAVPHLRERQAELPRIIDEYALDADLELGLPKTRIPDEDRAWIVKYEASSLSEIEKATLRLRAIRATDGNMTAAAVLLGMSRASLVRWRDRRQLPMRTNDDE
jgi:DNA-binding NtrC family response regulator